MFTTARFTTNDPRFTDTLLSWPWRPLVRARNRAETLINEALHALSFPRLGRVDVPLRIGGDTVHPEELTRLPPAIAERRQLLQRVALDDPHLLIGTISQIHVALLR